MHKIVLEIAFSDERGDIIDLLKEKVDAVTLITFERDAIRGNHIHADTTQWTYILEGLIDAYSQNSKGILVNQIFRSGEMFVSLPGEPHAMKALEKSKIIVLTKGPRSGEDYSTDTKFFGLI